MIREEVNRFLLPSKVINFKYIVLDVGRCITVMVKRKNWPETGTSTFKGTLARAKIDYFFGG